MSRYARHVDRNHARIVAVLRALGASAHAIQGATGTPDLIVGYAGVTTLAEVKPLTGDARSRELRDTQVAWHRAWRGLPVVVLRTDDDARALVSQLAAMSRPRVTSDVEVDPSDYERPQR